MNEPDQQHVFVYGTLMRGEENHAQMQGAHWVADSSVGPGWEMYLLDGYPGIVRASGGRSVVGELWQVSSLKLCELDAFEGVAEGLYRREQEVVFQGGQSLSAWIYVYAGEIKGRPRLSGDWRRRAQDTSGTR